ncbi:MAG: hypothetical protein ACRCZO_12795 [Cetobacterium sp.]|uniref:hypothetical protein n=1 Tax=Cetobacterium sp. TaxID=2071632 RepID=UPI003EE6C1C7
MKRINIMMLMGTLFIGTLSFAEREVNFDYEKHIEERNKIDKNNIINYAKINEISIEESEKIYKQKLAKEFKENETIRQEMILSNLSD